MNILVTGGTGFLGRHLVNRLKQDLKNQITVVNTENCNLLNKENLVRLNQERFDLIYHLAAWTKAGDFCLYHSGEQWINNQLINTNILWYWSKFQSTATFITMGTSCAYPDGHQDLIEIDYLRGEPSPDLYTYAMTKRMLLQGLRALNKQYGLNYQYLVPPTLYGPNFEKDDNHFIFDLVKKIYYGKTRNDPVVLWGDGYQIRELIYADDVVDLIIRFATTDLNQIINIGTGIGYTIRDCAAIISKALDFDVNRIAYDINAPYIGTGRRVLDNKKLRKEIENYKFTSLEEGVCKTIEYFKLLG